MPTVQKSLRIPRTTQHAIEDLATEMGIDFSAAANQLLEEAVRARRCPGVVFTSGPSGRRATIAGTGLDVWELVATDRAQGKDERRLKKAYHWLTDAQLQAALAYADLYPDEIEARIRQNESWSPASLRARYRALAVRQQAKAKRGR